MAQGIQFTSIGPTRIIATILVSWLSGAGCNLIDDDEPATTTSGATDGNQPSCLEAAVEIQANCESPLQFWADYAGGGGSMVLIDDPAASAGIGPGAWLVQVASAADYVGFYHHGGDSCELGCGWCAQGQHVCHGGLSDAGQPSCWVCLPFDTPDAAGACSMALSACLEDGLDETGGEPTTTGGGDEGSDGTGSRDSEGASPEYDCTMWEPEQGVSRDERGVIFVDAALITEITMYQGEPLSSCDDTRFRRRSDGYFEISRRSDHGLLAEMGLATGDVILAIDGTVMNELDTVIRVVGESLSSGITAAGFTLVIGRGDEQLVTRVLIR